MGQGSDTVGVPPTTLIDKKKGDWARRGKGQASLVESIRTAAGWHHPPLGAREEEEEEEEEGSLGWSLGVAASGVAFGGAA